MLLLVALTAYLGIPAGAWVVIGTTVSGLVLAWATKFFNRKVEARDDRKEFRDEIRELNERVDKLEEEVTKWRDRYYKEQNHSARLENIIIKEGKEPPERK